MVSMIARVAAPAGRQWDWLDKEDLAQLTPALLLDRARGIRDLAAQCAEETERQRRPLDQVVDAMRAAGIFYHFVPKRFGGLEFGLQSFIDIVTTVAEGCMSSAWIMSFYMQHNFLMSQMPRQAQDEVYGAYPYICAPATTAPPGNAIPTDGGYTVSGHWKYASGIMHADLLQLMAIVQRDGKAAEMRMFVLPVDQGRVIDTWYVDGLSGTGSADVVVDSVFVPEHMSVDFEQVRAGEGFGRDYHDNPLYGIAVDILLNISSASPAIGAARACVSAFSKRLQERSPRGTDGAPQIKPTALVRLAEANLAVEVAEVLLRDAAQRTEEVARARRVPTAEERLLIRSHIVFAVDQCKRAVRTVSDAAGTSAHNLDNPIQRAVRDVTVLASHAVYDWDNSMELLGRTITGVANANMFKHHSHTQASKAA
ncbi:hypothetical protein CAF53_25270 (plasmid) [Sphingobium sp. LB126]|uniref:hypothetical protein n=1 Tax=Sphingobium sp. LB126 TaxID=1983755 RepID=UPI000C209D7D|nr:hypothetical protein [Sphingobium sp. LB126]PJG45121.1 hypothetical protein CAF53_25270 [Sphingobium sp. LB126]